MKRRVLEMVGNGTFHKVGIFQSDKVIDRYLSNNDIWLNDVSKFRFDLIIDAECQFINDDMIVDSTKCRLADIYDSITRGGQIIIRNSNRKQLYYDTRGVKAGKNIFWNAIECTIKRSVVDYTPNYHFKVIITYDGDIMIKEVV